MLHMLGRSACQVRMDGTGRVLDEVKERHLENALPKVGSPAMVLLGEHRGETGTLLSRSSARQQASVQIDGDLTIVNLSLDAVAEWVTIPG